MRRQSSFVKVSPFLLLLSDSERFTVEEFSVFLSPLMRLRTEQFFLHIVIMRFTYL